MKEMNYLAFKEMLLSGGNNLCNNCEQINALNVFPVPDGDTGTNMKMTYTSGLNEVMDGNYDDIGSIAKVFSKNMLMGARGNSGVILSQIMKGFYKSVDGKKSINAVDMANAFLNGARLAYKAVMRPVEGTILTVIREASDLGFEYVKSNPNCTIESYIDVLVSEAETSLATTPDLLPVLKESGVVDSGGAGLVSILKGFQAYLNGNPVKLADVTEETEIDRGYLVEVEARITGEFDEDKLVNRLNRNCQEVKTLVKGEQLLVSVNSPKPGEVLNAIQSGCYLEKIRVEKITNDVQAELVFEDEEETGKYAIIAVCNSSGIADLFNKLGVKHIVSGGQTMNPSTEAFVHEIEKTKAEHIIILPNNSNIIMAAKQAKDVLKKRDIAIVETTSVPEGIAACVAFDEENDMATNVSNMSEAIKNVKTGSVTTAVKDTSYYNLDIHKDDYIGISGKNIAVSTKDVMDATRELLKVIIDDDSCFVTVIYGKDITHKQAEEIGNFLESSFGIEYELIDGKQELYPFIIGVE